jgi:hypothetical protein
MNNPFLLTTGNIDWSSQPDFGVWYESETFIVPGEPLQIKYRRLSSQDNASMINADLYGDSEQRYRNCLTIGCGKSFKFTHEDDWTCPDCEQQRAEIERRQGIEGDLLGANARVKP